MGQQNLEPAKISETPSENIIKEVDHEIHLSQTNEREFHHDEGYRIPFFLKIAWTILILWAFSYLIRYSWPNLQLWLNK